MILRSLFFTGLGFAILAPAQAATVNVGGIVLAPFQDAGGNTLPDGSIIQVGYLLGLDPSVDLSNPVNAANIDWNSFTAIAGFGSARDAGNYDTRVSSIFGPGGFFADGLEFDTDTDFGAPSELPVRIALRVFDSTTDTNANFNTYTGSSARFILEPPGAVPSPDLGRADIDINGGDSDLVWQGDPFRTTVAIPEPSTSLSMLLGLGLLASRRRRK